MSTPILTPAASHPSRALSAQTPQRPRPLSYSSVSSLGSNASLMMLPEGDVEEVTEEGVRHADLKLEARKYKTTHFRQALLQVLQTIRVPTWTSAALEPEHVKIFKVSGALTNAVFFISYSGNAPPTSASVPQSSASSTPHLSHRSSSTFQTSTPRTVLLRIYGPSSSTLISRTDELHTLHILSSVYRIGPRVLGTFQNGRVEEWFDSSALTAEDLRDPVVSRWIGMRMRELHSVDVLGVVGPTWNGQESILNNVLSWRGAAQEVLNMLNAKENKLEILPGHFWHGLREKLDLTRFMRAWDAYWAWLQKWEEEYGKSEMVFAHNDTQYGNLLRWNKPPTGKPDHHRIIVVDFEYAAPNPAAFDIANHFHEWMADYHSPDASHVLSRSKYPTRGERWNFYCGYLASPTLGGPFTASPAPTRQSSFNANSSLSAVNSFGSSQSGVDRAHTPKPPSGSAGTPAGQIEVEELMDTLDAQVYAWSPASHAMWVIWGIVQASDDVTTGEIGDFDYLGYAIGRLEQFEEELAERGIKW
ncbi:hypothetical protein FRC07_006573 [Ceratobasidium sp. 392]|nr:hypothetical protein FRC07_006573 [Ceratobasidium sp. 392]